MDEHDWLAERFEVHRTRMRAVAYRMLGSFDAQRHQIKTLLILDSEHQV